MQRPTSGSAYNGDGKIAGAKGPPGKFLPAAVRPLENDVSNANPAQDGSSSAETTGHLVTGRDLPKNGPSAAGTAAACAGGVWGLTNLPSPWDL